jgi:F0F1-type ATP synthase alpha subunit
MLVIETNLMSMTDGTYCDRFVDHQDRYQTVNHFLSVTRIRRQTQTDLGRAASQVILGLMNDYNNLKNFLVWLRNE